MTKNQIHFLLFTVIALTLFNMNSCIRWSDRRPPVENDFKNGFYMVVGSEKVAPNSKYVVSTLAQNTNEPVKIDLKFYDKNSASDLKEQLQSIVLDPSVTKKIEFDIGKLDQPDLRLDINATFNNKTYSNSMHINYNPKLVSIFVQTDKAMYKPGEKVQFRVILTDSNLLPISDDNKINVFITDPKRNRIKQWLNSTITDGVFTGSLQLNEEQVLGNYVINVNTMGTQKKAKNFEVAEYVLPQFEVKLLAPKHVVYEDPKFTATVDARYTHGKPINGLLKFTMKQRYFYSRSEFEFWPEERSHEKIEIEKPINGNVDVELNPVQQLNLVSSRDYELEIELEAIVTETLTKKNFTKTTHIQMVDDNVRMEVLDTNEELKPGLPIEFSIKIINRNEEPITDTKDKVKLGYRFNIKDSESTNFTEQDYEIKNGLIDLKFDVPKDATDLYIRARYKGRKYSIHHFQAPSAGKSNHFIQLAVLNKPNRKNVYKTGQKVDLELRTTVPISNYTYMLIKKGNVVSSNTVELKQPSIKENININVEHELAPKFKVVVFYFTKENEVVSDQKTIEVDDLFLTPIDIKSNTNQTQPGEKVDITVKTNPNAFVGVLGVDQSVLLLKTGNDISKQDIMDDLQAFGGGDRYGYWHRRSRNSFFGSTDVFSSNNLFCIMNGFDVNENYYRPVNVMNSFGGPTTRSGMSSSRVAVDEVALEADFAVAPQAAPASLNFKMANFESGSKQQIKVRKDFPETWLFENLKADEKEGTAVFSKNIPDTITSWVVSAFAVDKKTGIVVSENPAKVTVFRPFFLKINLPYSIVRGEIASIQILVFNYMDTDQKVRVNLFNDKDQYKFVTSDDQENDIEQDSKVKEEIIDVKANEVGTVSFLITAKKAGNLILRASAITLDDKAGDKVERTLKVKSEGQTIYKNKALLINLKNNEKNEQKFEIEFPENAIEGSKLINLNAIGDILGTSMANIDDLLRLPYGCGEQNIAALVPNIIVLDYLTQSNKLTNKIKEKAIRNLESGYQRQLQYQRLDGSYSAFGEKDKEGSTWLTAFVLKSFVQAKKYIDIDPKVLESSVKYLEKQGYGIHNNLTYTGSFVERGHLFSKALQGGVAKNTLPLTAYVLIALNIAKNNGVNVTIDLKKAEDYLAEQSKTINLLANEEDPDDPNQYNYYQLAIISQALHELNSDKKDEIYEKLWKLGQTEDNKLFFDKKQKKDDKKDNYIWWHIPNSNSVEATSYALLTAIKRKNTSDAVKILNWLVSKQNNNGGFSSTQDTVIALESLAAIANQLYVKDTKIEADFVFDGLEKAENLKPKLKVDDSNALELQTYQMSETNFEEEFKKIKKATMNASGSGNAVIQVGWQYNIASNYGEFFNLTAKATSPSNQNGEKDTSQFTLEICTNYKKKGDTNMAVIEIELPSGYVFNYDKIDELRKDNPDIKRIDMKNSNTLGVFYFDKLNATPTCFSIDADRQIKVAKLKPALVKVYDYYKIEEAGRAFYLPDKVNVCDICDNEECSKTCKKSSK